MSSRLGELSWASWAVQLSSTKIWQIKNSRSHKQNINLEDLWHYLTFGHYSATFGLFRPKNRQSYHFIILVCSCFFSWSTAQMLRAASPPFILNAAPTFSLTIPRSTRICSENGRPKNPPSPSPNSTRLKWCSVRNTSTCFYALCFLPLASIKICQVKKTILERVSIGIM